MTHEEAYLMMMDALDGTLAPADAETLERHLALCTECGAEWKMLQWVDGLLHQAPVVAAPAGFGERVQARLEESPWQRTLGALFALSAGSVVALLLVAIPVFGVVVALVAAYREPASFASLLIWLDQLVGVSGSILDAIWTTVYLFFVQVASSPLTLVWATAAALAVAVWARLVRQPDLVRVQNGF